jgi:YidC/Oxa1 family membrane protein insertase
VDFLYTAISWVLLRWHDLFSALGFSDTGNSAWAWILSIVFLVITARLALVRLFIKQVHYQRHMMKMQPKIQKIREKYKNDRAEMQRQMMEMQQAEGFNPLSGCLPMFLQIPIFIALYHTLRHLANTAAPLANGKTLCGDYQNSHLLTLYGFTKDETCSAATAKLFGAPLASSFHDSDELIRSLGGDNPTQVRVVLVVLLVVSAAATLVTQLLVRWNNPVQPEGTAATVQKAMLYLIPVGVLASGLLFNFPLGVLLYWFTSNLWTLGQQAYIIRYHPHEEPSDEPKGEMGRTLAPRPGQRPVRMTKGDDDDTLDDDDAAPPSAAPARSAPRPGQRPNRPAGGGKRPAGKRPSQSKKRR